MRIDLIGFASMSPYQRVTVVLHVLLIVCLAMIAVKLENGLTVGGSLYVNGEVDVDRGTNPLKVRIVREDYEP